MRYFALTVATLLVFGCGSPTAPDLERPVRRYEALPIYSEWWSEVESCLGRSGRLSRITWYEVEGGPFMWRGDLRNGLWSPPHEIRMAETQKDDEWSVKHEMIHDLTNGADHDHPAFGRCDVPDVDLP